MGAIDRSRPGSTGRSTRLEPVADREPGDAPAALEPRASVAGRVRRQVHSVPSTLRSAMAVALAPKLRAARRWTQSAGSTPRTTPDVFPHAAPDGCGLS